jgi:hypothetical protein
MRLPAARAGLVFSILMAAAAAGAQPVAPRHGGLGGFARRSGADFRHLPTWESLLWLGGGGVASLLAHSEDRDWVESLAASDDFEEFLDPGKIVGSEVVLLPATLLTYGIGRWADRPGLEHAADDLLRAQLVSQVMTHGLKLSVGRERPDGERWSFPSGHSSASFAVATVLASHGGWKFGVPAYAGAAYVALSRMAERRHYASDVIFGAAIGIVAGRTVTRDGATSWRISAWGSNEGATGLRLTWSPAAR